MSRPSGHAPPVSTTRLLLAVPALVLLASGWSRRWVGEDAFICFRVVDQLLARHGPVFNVGERVEAYTNPLWVALLAAWSSVLGHVEWGSVLLGLAGAVAGLALGSAGAARLAASHARGAPGRTVALPVGALIFACTAAVRDFATSGLETGLEIFWLGSALCLLARAAVPDRPAGASRGGRLADVAGLAWLGAGPLIRPDLGLFAAGFLLIRGNLDARRVGRRSPLLPVVRAVAIGFAAVAAYELFRLGYFGALISNSSLAKEPALSNWRLGFAYLRDFVVVYRLWLVAPLLLLAGVRVRAGGPPARHVLREFVGPILILAALHALFVVRVGGDFMHGRFLLPAFFTTLMMVDALAVGTWPGRPASREAAVEGWLTRAGLLLALAWCATAFVALGPRYLFGPTGIADERRFYVEAAGRPNPVTLADYATADFGRDGRILRQLAASVPRAAGNKTGPGAPTGRVADAPLLTWRAADGGERELGGGAASPRRATTRGVSPLEGAALRRPSLVLDLAAPPATGYVAAPDVRVHELRDGLPPPIRCVAVAWNIGIIGFAAGPDVHVVDRLGLAEPIGARLRLTRRGRAGHEKILDDAWVIARFAAATADEPEAVRRARERLAEPDLVELAQAIGAPLTPARFCRNLTQAWRLTRLRIDG